MLHMEKGPALFLLLFVQPNKYRAFALKLATLLNQPQDIHTNEWETFYFTKLKHCVLWLMTNRIFICSMNSKLNQFGFFSLNRSELHAFITRWCRLMSDSWINVAITRWFIYHHFTYDIFIIGLAYSLCLHLKHHNWNDKCFEISLNFC